MRGAETWTLKKVDLKYMESQEMWCWGRIEKISWNDRVITEEVLNEVTGERNIMCTATQKKEG